MSSTPQLGSAWRSRQGTPRRSAGSAMYGSPHHTPQQARGPGDGQIPKTPLGRVSATDVSSQSSPVFRRSVPFGSPSARVMAARGSPAVDAPRADADSAQLQRPGGYVRRRSWEAWLVQLPSALLARLQSLQMDIEELIHRPSLGLPLALLFHALSLLAQILLPGSSFALPGLSSAYVPPSQRRGQAKLFASERRFGGGGPGSYAASLGRMIAAQRTVALRWTSVALSAALMAISMYNTYLLFSKRKDYRLWYRSEADALKNKHASLQAPPREEPSPPSWEDRAKVMALSLARQVPIVEWFVPPSQPPPPPETPTESIYTLRVWDVLEVPLQVFTYVTLSFARLLTGSIYSPAHALWWAIAGSLGMHAVTTWLVTAVFMTLFSVQAYFFSQEYTELVKDRSVISAEMLREYDEKVCAQDRAAV